MNDLKPSPIDIIFTEANAGWLIFEITSGKKKFKDRFSNVFDPVMDLKAWLEAISVGVMQCSFDYNSEGYETRFDFKKETPVLGHFKIYDITNSEKKLLFDIIVKTKEFVKKFYYAVIDFALSDIYKPAEWEEITYKDLLLKTFPYDLETLLLLLIKLPPDILNELFFKLKPEYEISFEKAKDKEEELSLFINYATGKITEKEKTEYGFKAKRLPWKIFPSGFSRWSKKRKLKFLKEVIEEDTGFGGTKLSEFFSQVIEKFISDK